MKLVIGLGNPGRQYEMTRHNIGFMVIDYLAGQYHAKVNKSKCRALCGEAEIEGERVLLVKPQTFMNLSGESVRELCDYFKIPPEDIVVIYDDKDIEAGKIRIREKGSAGGHNGMKSIIYQLQTDQFARIRVGIGQPKDGMIEFVLGQFSKEEQPKIEAAGKNAAEAVGLIVQGKTAEAMGRFNGMTV